MDAKSSPDVRTLLEASGAEATPDEFDAAVAAFPAVIASLHALRTFDPRSVGLEWDLDPSRAPTPDITP